MKLLKLTYLQYVVYATLCFTLLMYAIVKCKSVLAPLTIAVLISLALSSVLVRVQKVIPSNLLAVTLVTGVFFAILYGIIYGISSQISDFYTAYPNISDKLVVLIHKAEHFIEDAFGINNIRFIETTENNKDQIIVATSKYLLSLLGNLTILVMYVTLIPLYIFLLLLYKDNIKQGVKKVLTPMQIKTKTLFKESTVLLQNYLKGLLLVMLILGLANGIGLYFLKVPYAFALGFLVALLAIIPYIGVTLGGVFVMFVSFVTQESIPQLVYIAILFGVIQFIEGNFLTPKVIGDKININPILAIVLLIIGEQMWGITGMIVVLPIAAITTILIKNLKKESFLPSK